MGVEKSLIQSKFGGFLGRSAAFGISVRDLQDSDKQFYEEVLDLDAKPTFQGRGFLTDR